ncbi:MAG: DUF2116 family Zn-ribbon domain-containing protein [Rhodobacteraceae bacterium]|nr:DUF2116 family Zn-ribbon domain-containing protein [Paracoccaceae bacterium]
MSGLVRLTRREQDALRGKLARMRSDELTGHLCRITREALADGRIITPLALEGLFRQVIRSSLCLQGWRWQDADRAAMAVVGVVLSILQAKRPSWNEGQREWTIERGTLIERTRCANCGKKLEGDQKKFCSVNCASAYNQRLNRLRAANEAFVAKMVTRARL